MPIEEEEEEAEEEEEERDLLLLTVTLMCFIPIKIRFSSFCLRKYHGNYSQDFKAVVIKIIYNNTTPVLHCNSRKIIINSCNQTEHINQA